mmetsp:Transcript_30640/g.55572  ORF Transcript_30640/g.55572 Transcript_30640/m.55572 type:complete len:172 (+) Transcript_30640:68-583(+)
MFSALVMLLSVALAGASNRSLRGLGEYAHSDCCNSCSTEYCSPQSGSCYSTLAKSYYLTCYAYADCCDGCGAAGWQYCSPKSASCYNTYSKSYYLTCQQASPAPAPPPAPASNGVKSVEGCCDECSDAWQYCFCSAFEGEYVYYPWSSCMSNYNSCSTCLRQRDGSWSYTR